MIFDESDYDDYDVELPAPIVDTDMDAKSLDRNKILQKQNLVGCTKAGITIIAKKKNKKLIKVKKGNSYTKKMNTEISRSADKSDSLLNTNNAKSLDRKIKVKVKKVKKVKKTDCELKEEDDFSYKPKNHKFITLTETFDVDKLNYIIEHFEEFKLQLRWRARYDRNPPLAQLIRYRDASVNGKIVIKYCQRNGMGRFQALSPSLQGIAREIRHTISRENYVDIDMVNSHPTILQWMCNKEGFQCKYLDRYISKREFYIKKLMDKNDIDRDTAKITYLTITNGGDSDYKKLKNKTKHIVSYKNEMTHLHGLFTKLNPKRFKEVKSKRIKVGKNYNHEAALMNCLMLDIENDILMAMYKFFGNPKDSVLCFDGIMVRKTKDYQKLDMEGCEKFIFKKTGIHTVIKEKSMNQHLDLKGCDIKKYKPYLSDYTSDNNYYWFDFMKDANKTFESLLDVKRYVKRNINRVMFRIYSGDYYVRKLSRDLTFYIGVDLPKEVFVYKKKMKNDPENVSTEIKTITLQQLMVRHGLLSHVKSYNTMTFDPSNKNSKRDFNMWNGFKAKLVDKDEADESKCKLIYDAIFDIWCDRDDERFKYIKSWFHNIFRYPEKKSKIVPILNSTEKQIGKGIIINHFLIPYVFGRRCSMTTTGLDTIASKFNEIMMNQIFINCEELTAKSGDGYNAMFDKLKSRITEDMIKIEIKGGKTFMYPDRCNYMGCTNHRNTIRLEEGDVRYYVAECSSRHKNDYSYFDKLAESFTDEAASHFFSCIYHMEDPVDLRKIPETTIKTEMIMGCASSSRKFLMDIKDLMSSDMKKDDFDFENWQYDILLTNSIRSGKFYNIYKKYCSDNSERVLSNQKFGRDIRGYITKGVDMWRTYDLSTIK